MGKLTLLLLIASAGLRAETGEAAWLRYAPISLEDGARRHARAALPAVVATVGDSELVATAGREIERGVRGMLGRTLRVERGIPAESAIVLSVASKDTPACPEMKAPESYCLRRDANHIFITGNDERGVLYGAFAFLRKVALGEPMDDLDEQSTPYAPVRWINQWDNLDGSIERGYGGRSIFWENGRARADLRRVEEYGRLLASLGVNGCSIDNVNSNPKLLSDEMIPDFARIAAAFRPWGVRVVLSVDFGSPKTVGGLDTFDPLDPRVAAFWKDRVDAIYKAVPDLGGFVLKADSEGRVGPSAYGRTHADAANVVARALKPHGGLLFYRGFVYDHHMDWRNLKNDRARAAYDNFKPLDGKFDDNVLIQIKNGPIDFQVREPASPLFGALEKTNQAIELQITQEYFGQARHMVFLVPYWKDTFDFDMHAAPEPTPVKALVAGKVFHRPTGGFVGVANVGLDANWLGNPLSQANLYGFGRLAWNPDLSSDQIAREWTRLTLSADPKVVETVSAMQLRSWRVYEDYTGPLGLQTLTAISGNHYGVDLESSERNGWGQWHRADEKGVGMDRTVANGTGFVGQYRPPVAKRFESLETCPDELVLFFHHLPYTHVLHSGKTVIQTLYDWHYDGARAAARYVNDWSTLHGKIDDERFRAVLEQLTYQAGQAEVWRDAVANWFHRESRIPDAQGRVGNHAGRSEAEAMQLEGYTVVDATPWEGASGKAVSCPVERCTATLRYNGPAGWYALRVRYFDQNNGVAHYRVSVGGQVLDAWAADDHVPTRRIDSSSSALRIIRGVGLRPGDDLRIEGIPNGGETAALDYVEIQPDEN